MLINTNTLPPELKNKLPLTLRNQKTIDTKYIPDPILRQEIESYIEIQQLKQLDNTEILNSYQNEQIQYNTSDKHFQNTNYRDYQQLLRQTLDIKPEKDIYGLKLITNEAEYILQQLKTFLSLGSFEIPFSPEVNFDITKYIFHIDNPYIKEELYNIINDFILILTTELSLNTNSVKLISVNVQKLEEDLFTTYLITVALEINNQQYTLNLNFQVKTDK